LEFLGLTAAASERYLSPGRPADRWARLSWPEISGVPHGCNVDHQEPDGLPVDPTDRPTAGPPDARSADELRRELWGYGVWSFVAVVIAVPELWAIYGDPPWPTISATVAHLKQHWPWVSLIVVTVIVATAVEVLTRLHATPTGVQLSPSQVSRRLGRTAGGRATPGSTDAGELDRAAWTAYLATSTSSSGWPCGPPTAAPVGSPPGTSSTG
jgi:hypothetical protein